MNFYLGIDFGTSGARAVVINAEGVIQCQTQYPFTEKLGRDTAILASTIAQWEKALYSLIEEIPQEIRRAIGPPNHTVLSATSSLAKFLWFIQNSKSKIHKHCYFLHQADWLAFLLHGQLGISDYHNALKLGYDPEHLCYPIWMEQLPETPALPQVLAPGTAVGEVTADVSQRLGLPRDCVVCTGTTDSIAAFLASDAKSPGEAVTSLGSTLVL